VVEARGGSGGLALGRGRKKNGGEEEEERKGEIR
jgi:hypothetical protein